MWVRIRRKVGSPTAAVMRHLPALRPSVEVICNQCVGILLRSRMGGLRTHSHSGSPMICTPHGCVRPSFSSTPRRNCSHAASDGTAPSTCTQYILGFVHGVADLVLQATIVGQQYQAFGVGIQTPGGINVGYAYMVCQARVCSCGWQIT